MNTQPRKYIPTDIKVDLGARFYLPQTLADQYLREYRSEVIATDLLFTKIVDGTYQGYAITWMLRPSSVRQRSQVRLSFRSPHSQYNDIDRVLITGVRDAE